MCSVSMQILYVKGMSMYTTLIEDCKRGADGPQTI